jgi:DNA (cytosine-5)-methyltransferase 1
MNHGSLFSGIGGFDLAAEWMGWKNLFNCEWEEFPRKVLKHHFPNAEQYGDIREFNASNYAGRIDILSGGFPCQPYSVAGKRLGKEDERHLWPEMLRIIRECSPRWVVGENVRGLVNWSGGLVFEEVCADLEACGYSVQPFILPACAVNAPHRRDRVWFIAHTNDERIKPKSGRERQECKPSGSELRSIASAISKIGNVADTDSDRLQGGLSTDQHKQERSKKRDAEKCVSVHGRRVSFDRFPTVPPICGGDDGLPKELDGITFSKWRRESIKAYGNAIVPQVALRIFEAIQEYEIST